MRSRITLAFAVLLAVAVAGPLPAQADWDDRPEPGEYEESLSPHGYWADDSDYGRVWRPSVGWDWQPYVDGQWSWTSYGWTWVSYEPWAWTFHYGRWALSNLYGWVWTPGYVWGPAWVNWYWGNGYVGWAPLGPAGFAVVPSYWNYVHDYHFCASRVNTAIIRNQRYLPDYVVHHSRYGRGRAEAPGLRDIERVSRHPVSLRGDRPNESIAPWVHHRLERGEAVRERVADRNGERVIEHGTRPRDHKDAPPVADGGGWRKPRADQRPDAGGFLKAPPASRGSGLTHRRDDADTDRGRSQPQQGAGDSRGQSAFTQPRQGRGAGDADAMAHGRSSEPPRGWSAPRRGTQEPQGTIEVPRPAPRMQVYERTPPRTGNAPRPMAHEPSLGGAHPAPQGSAAGNPGVGGDRSGQQGRAHGGAHGAGQGNPTSGTGSSMP